MNSNDLNSVNLSQSEIGSGILGYKAFNCQGFDFNFQFPDFKDWEYKYTEKRHESLCIIYFNWPDNIEYEVPPAIEVQKIVLEIKSENLKQNPQGIYYEYIQDPTLYVVGHKFEEGDWDWLVFYGKDFGVRIGKAMFGEPPFDANQFYKKIIETFDFK